MKYGQCLERQPVTEHINYSGKAKKFVLCPVSNSLYVVGVELIKRTKGSHEVKKKKEKVRLDYLYYRCPNCHGELSIGSSEEDCCRVCEGAGTVSGDTYIGYKNEETKRRTIN